MLGYHGWSVSSHPAVNRKSRSQKNVDPNSKLIPEFGSFPTATITWPQSSMLSQVHWCSPLGPGWSLSVMFPAFPGAVCEFLSDASGRQAAGSFFLDLTSLSNEILS